MVTSVKLEGKAFQRQSKSWTVIFWGRCLPSRLNLSEGGGVVVCLLLNHAEMLWCRRGGPGAAHSGPLSLWSCGTVLPCGPSGLPCPSLQLGPAHHQLLATEPITKVAFQFTEVRWILFPGHHVSFNSKVWIEFQLPGETWWGWPVVEEGHFYQMVKCIALLKVLVIYKSDICLSRIDPDESAF